MPRHGTGPVTVCRSTRVGATHPDYFHVNEVRVASGSQRLPRAACRPITMKLRGSNLPLGYGANMNGVTTSAEVRSMLAVCVGLVGTRASSVYFAAAALSGANVSVVAPAT